VPRPTRETIQTLLIVLALYALVVGAMLVADIVPSRAAFDSKLYHLPTIKQFAQTWPSIDPWDYLSATTPGYHWLLSGVWSLTGGSLRIVLIANALITAGFFALAAWLIARLATGSHGPRWLPVLLCLPLLANNYLLMPGVALLPDAAGWLGVLAMIAICLTTRTTVFTLVTGGVLLLATVLTRQLHVWIAGLFLLALWSPPMDSQVSRRSTSAANSRLGPVALGLIACIPAALMLLLFVRYWEGLVPPRFQGQYPPRGLGGMLLSPAPAFILAVVGALSPFFAGFWGPGLLRLWKDHRFTLLGVCAVGIAVAIFPATNFDYQAGRRTGLWNLAAHFPVLFGHTSVLILMLTTVGALVLACFATLLDSRPRVILLACLLGYAIVMTASAEVWQRYVEPLALLVLVLMSARVTGLHAQSSLRRRLARNLGPLLLAVAFTAVTLRTFKAGVESWGAPAPAPMATDHVGPPPPVVLDAPAKPAGKVFW